MVQVLAEDSPSYATVKKWAAKFKQDRHSTEDDPQSGHSKAATIDKQVDAIHCMVLNDRHLSLPQTVKSIGITSGFIHTVLTENLGMNQLFARWVIRMQMPEHKLKRVDISRTILIYFQVNSKNFHYRLVIQNETWVLHFEHESNIQSK